MPLSLVEEVFVEATVAMERTVASQLTSGSAEKLTVALCPTDTWGMSTSLTCTVTISCERSAILMKSSEELSVVAEELVPIVEPTAWPDTAFISMMLPALGAVTVLLAAIATALS